LNAKAEEMLGWSQKEAAGKKCTEVFKISLEKTCSPDLDIVSDQINENEVEELKNNLSELLLEKGEINNQEAVLTSKTASCFPIEFSAAFVEKTRGKVIIFREISQRKDMEKRLKKYASTDRLTEVLNRRAGLDYLKEEMKLAEAADDVLSVIFIDVNDLKLVNDNFGHQEGDELLQKISDILQHSLRRNDKVVRLGGDEFFADFDPE
ncbi:MAG: diguanylate cyclase, partial [Halanaerobiales bacterium]|nr:diguanylate cyclase [Halanaerobiales bacterium]